MIGFQAYPNGQLQQEDMLKRISLLSLMILASIAGNLIAGWIQQDIWRNFFTPARVIGTAIGLVIVIATSAFLERQSARPVKKKNMSNTALHSDKTNMVYDLFISHATEDKDTIVRPLAQQLQANGIKVWYDEFEITLGDSLRESIDRGLATSKFGLVIVSKHYLKKNYTSYELNGLFAREIRGRKVILPIWHELEIQDIIEVSPSLADKFALNTSNMSVDEITEAITEFVLPN